jgi:hypothetical protein
MSGAVRRRPFFQGKDSWPRSHHGKKQSGGRYNRDRPPHVAGSASWARAARRRSKVNRTRRQPVQATLYIHCPAGAFGGRQRRGPYGEDSRRGAESWQAVGPLFRQPLRRRVAESEHRGEKKYDRAIAAFTEVIRLDPANGQAYRWRAQAYALSGDQAKADSDYDRAGEVTAPVPAEKPVGPAMAKAMSFRMGNYESEADCDQAIRDITEAPAWVRQKFGVDRQPLADMIHVGAEFPPGGCCSGMPSRKARSAFGSTSHRWHPSQRVGALRLAFRSCNSFRNSSGST